MTGLCVKLKTALLLLGSGVGAASCGVSPVPLSDHEVIPIVRLAAREIFPHEVCEEKCRAIAVDTVVRFRRSLPVGLPLDSVAAVLESSMYDGLWGDSVQILPWATPVSGWEVDEARASFYLIRADSIPLSRALVGVVTAPANGSYKTWAVSLKKNRATWQVEKKYLYYEF